MPTEFKDTSVEVVVVVQPLASEEITPKYNAWGKLTTKKSITEAIAKMRQLRQAVALVQGQGDAEMGRQGRKIQTGIETPPEFKRLNLLISVGVLNPWDLRPRVRSVPASPRLFR